VLDLTRILAGPVAGRTLAAYGADVMLVNSPRLPNIEAIAETSRGKRSAHVDLATEAGRRTLRELVSQCDVLLQAYRPGALARLGFGTEALAAVRPGIVVASLSAYGRLGPWAERRGFDSLVQSATGLNAEEAQAFGAPQPRALPVQALDYGAGFLLAFGAQAALLRQREQGGSWEVQVSLAGVGRWLRGLGRMHGAAGTPPPDFSGAMEATPSGFGLLRAVPHAARFSHTPAGWTRPSVPPGTDPPRWPTAEPWG
jgi:crotonobetainyl-CoA:carnitine CoA-transferase CaiB-like acyl-CoA transferase